jgi:hypothetical protein
MGDEEDEDVEEKEHGIFLPRHELHAEAHLDENDEWMDDWPVKQVLGNRFDQDGEIEYEVQYLGFTQHVQNDWRGTEEFRLDTIWKKYNRLHGLPILDEDGEQEEDQEMDDDEHEQDDEEAEDLEKLANYDDAYEEDESEDEMDFD